MLKAYLDLGEKSDLSDGIASLACAIYKPILYKQFVRPWNRFLGAWGASAFHATDFYSGADEFERNSPRRIALFEEHSRNIPALIAKTGLRFFFVSFRPEEFREKAPAGWFDEFGDSVHAHAVQLCLLANGHWKSKKYPTERFAYFMESGDTDEGEVLKAVEKMRGDYHKPTAKLISINSFTTVAKGLARGIEAADFVAWHWNKYYMDKIRSGNDDKPRKDFEAFVAAAQQKINYINATGPDLEFFFSLVPREILEK